MATKGSRENFSGDISVTAPTGGYTAGKIYQLASGAFAVARETKSASSACLMALAGAGSVIYATKVTGTGKSFSVGSKVYYVSASASATPSATGNTLIGIAVRAAATTDTEVAVLLSVLPPTAT